MAKKKEVPHPEEITIPIKWHIPDDLISRYASNMLVQIMENEFRLSFFEARPSIRIGDKDPLPTEVRADCVGSVIVSPKKMPAFINALQTQYKIFEEREQAGTKKK